MESFLSRADNVGIFLCSDEKCTKQERFVIEKLPLSQSENSELHYI